MCLILIAIAPTPELSLVVAANRDEFYTRPASQADFWSGTDILAGKDLEAGGTWLGINRQGRFAAVTNYREDPPDPLPPRSRGDLPTRYLQDAVDATDYLTEIDHHHDDFRGFNLLLGEKQQFHYYCNRQRNIIMLGPGCYGLSNQVLDCDWPKVNTGRDQLSAMVTQTVEVEPLFEMLKAPGTDQAYSNPFISSADYGTRASTVIIMRSNGEVYFEERQFFAHGEPGPHIRHEFDLDRSGC